MNNCIVIPVTEMSQVGEARRIAVSMATDIGFDEREQGKVAIVVTEAANNLIKHALNGELSLRYDSNSLGSCIQVVALDKGPGMANVSQCLRDGFSTTGTAGSGLGAIQRLSDFLDIYSVPSVGTVLVAQLQSTRGKDKLIAANLHSPHLLEIGVMQLPKTGQEICGDAWTLVNKGSRYLILVADGLGSGPLAREASESAVQILQANFELNPKAILEKAHAALRSTRGAAVGIAEINTTEQTVRFAGVGNISGTIITDTSSRNLFSYNGIVGYEARKIEEFTYPYPQGSLLVMYSDGLTTQWSLQPYPGLITHHPSAIAAVLYRDFKRSRDDVTVVVAKMSGGKQ